MDLGKKIQQVLKNNSSVYVNGLGVFSRVHYSSTFDEKRKIYLPPLDYITFDSESSQGIGLAHYIQQEKNLSREEAENVVSGLVATLKQDLHDHREAQIKGLGNLVQHGNSIIFKSVGLDDISLGPVQDVEPKEERDDDFSEQEIVHEVTIEDTQVQDEAEPLTVVEEEETMVTVDEPIVNEQPFEPESVAEEYIEEPIQEKSKTGLYVLIAVLALLVVGAVWYLNQPKGKDLANTTGSTTDTTQNAEVRADTSAGTTDSVPLRPTTVSADAPVIPDNHHWYIVIGSRMSIADARAIQAEYNGKGFPGVRVMLNRSGRLATVIWDSFEKKEEVDSVLRIVRRNYVPDAWRAEVKR